MADVQKRILIVDDDDEIRELLEFDIAQSGYFSSDRTIREYAKEIWDLHPIPFKK